MINIKFNKKIKVFAFCILCLLNSMLFSNAEANKISNIYVKGLVYESDSSFLRNAKLHAGIQYSTKDIDKTIKLLYAKGNYKDIHYTKEINPDGSIDLTFYVTENTRIDDINVVGSDSIYLTDFYENSLTKKNKSALGTYVKSDISFLKDKYLEDGYYFVDIKTKIIIHNDLHILNFEISEGPRVIVTDIFINIDGVPTPIDLSLPDNFSQDTEVDLIPNFLSFIETLVGYSEKYLNTKRLNKDLAFITMQYRNMGWHDAKVFLEDIEFSKDKTKARLTIRINKGNLYYVNKIKFEGNTVYDGKTLASKTKLEENNTFKLDVHKRDINSIMSLYYKKGYAECFINPKYEYLENNRINITYVITENEKFYLGRIKFVGNNKTRDKVLRREMEIAPGDILDTTKIKSSFQALRDTRYFSNIYPPKFEDSETEKNTKDLEIRVEEAPTGKFVFGGGYNSNAGLVGMISLQQSNFDISNPPSGFDDVVNGNAFAGAGQSMMLRFQPGAVTSNYLISFGEPYIFNSQYGGNLSLSTYYRGWSYYSEKHKSLEGSLSRKFFDKRLSLGLSGELATINIFDLSASSPPDILAFEGKSKKHSVTPFLSFNTVDSMIFPSKGMIFKASYEFTGGSLGGDLKYQKLISSADFIKTIYTTEEEGKITLKFSPTFGYIGKGGLPFYDKFYAGGMKILRGFEYRTVSPKYQGDAIGGKKILTGSLELAFPLYSNTETYLRHDYVRGFIFGDAGSVVDNANELFDNDQIRTSVGVGVELRFPQFQNLPIRISYGVPIKMQDDDESSRFIFDIGVLF